jgi:hypothetical protein
MLIFIYPKQVFNLINCISLSYKSNYLNVLCLNELFETIVHDDISYKAYPIDTLNKRLVQRLTIALRSICTTIMLLC